MASDEEKDGKSVVVPRTAAHLQKLKLEKLMKNPDKPVVIPERGADWAPRAPPEFIRNVWGSSAGAGSGDFHVYRGVRRREYARQKYITEKSEKDQKDEEYHKKVEENKKAAEERVSKKRAKRQKKKEKMKAKKMKNGHVNQENKKQEESESDSGSDIESHVES